MIKKTRNCFGILDEVFPVGPNGLREVVAQCFECRQKKACLQKALATREGLQFRRQILERADRQGLVGRLQRWSQKKALSRLQSQGRKPAK